VAARPVLRLGIDAPAALGHGGVSVDNGHVRRDRRGANGLRAVAWPAATGKAAQLCARGDRDAFVAAVRPASCTSPRGKTGWR
jgi:hypothetical protein